MSTISREALERLDGYEELMIMERATSETDIAKIKNEAKQARADLEEIERTFDPSPKPK